MADRFDKALQPWRQFRRGARVKLLCRWRSGYHATVLERLDDRVDGLARYAVKLDNDDNTSDVTRDEIRPLRSTTGRLLFAGAS